jgi:hypothetical protein
MAKQRRAKHVELPTGGQLVYTYDKIENITEDILDSTGRTTPLPEYSGFNIVRIVLKKNEKGLK